jgi:hypothetical protein
MKYWAIQWALWKSNVRVIYVGNPPGVMYSAVPCDGIYIKGQRYISVSA